MKCVFLDQLHWIALARTVAGDNSSPRLVDAYELIKYTSSNGMATFALNGPLRVETLER